MCKQDIPVHNEQKQRTDHEELHIIRQVPWPTQTLE